MERQLSWNAEVEDEERNHSQQQKPYNDDIVQGGIVHAKKTETAFEMTKFAAISSNSIQKEKKTHESEDYMFCVIHIA